jgi:single-stranded-DNA-specific exonuclease
MLAENSPAGAEFEKPPVPKERAERVWQVRPAAPPDFIQQLTGLGYSPLAAQLLYNRGLTDPAGIEYYFKATYGSLADPFLIKDMGRAVERIKAALADHQRIAIYGDFDTDGVTACSLLVQYFRASGASVVPRIPHRVDEGYGLNQPALDRLAAQQVKLVITAIFRKSNTPARSAWT